MSKESRVKLAFVSLGCDKNTIDSEIMLHILSEEGFELTKEEKEAEVIVINTCGFIQDAKEESIETIIEMGAYKENGCLRCLAVCGCLAQRYAKEIEKELPEVDLVIGTGSYEKIAALIREYLEREEKKTVRDLVSERDLGYRKRMLLTPGHFEYLRIAAGCDNRCSYCIIPALRGPYRSRKEEDILAEARDLAAAGVREICLVAQDITKYGLDFSGERLLPRLLRSLCKIDGIEWIRLLYAYPEDVTDELIETMAQEPKVLHYLDIPIQHCSDRVLGEMGRHHTKEMLRDLLRRLRSRMPDIAVRTTLITGFPGETAEEFEEMKAFIEEARFDRLGVFAYSAEEGTEAGKRKDQLPSRRKEKQKDALMALQQRVSGEISSSMIGKELTVFVDGLLPDEGEDGVMVYSARTYRDAPEIDGFLFLTSKEPLQTGDMVRARVTGAYEYDLIGEQI